MATNAITVGVQERNTKYVAAVREHIQQLGHATNAELQAALRSRYPKLSATTVHRVTARMLDRGEIILAPAGKNNAQRFDANTDAHDHFMCQNCGMLRDADLNTAVRPLIEQTIGDGCQISGRLVVSGICKHCKAKERRS